MKQFQNYLLIAGVLGALSWLPNPVAAQGAPDIRSVPPVVMLLVDTSGSMQKIGDCACSTPTCSECMPNCGVASPDRNRWATVTEALTGEFPSFGCNVQDRNLGSFAGQPDFRYYLPHIAPTGNSCNAMNPCPVGQSCSPLGICQVDDGILDIYRDRVKFGLMTFDGTNAAVGEGILMTEVAFRGRLGTCMNASCDNGRAVGGFSYGGPRPFQFDGCAQPYMLDNGARNETVAVPGRLVSSGSTALAGGEEVTTSFEARNLQVQTALLAPSMRPYGATPIAGMLSDLEYYFDHHPDVRDGSGGDPFHGCRDRFAILLTDGAPNLDMRGEPYYCETTTPVLAGMPDGCPYRRPEQLALRLVDNEDVEGLYVVGFDVDPNDCPIGDLVCRDNAQAARDELNQIAFAGDTDQAIFVDSNRAELRQALARILDETAPGTTTRTVPAVGNVGSGSTGPQSQVRFKTGFQVASPGDLTAPWSGALDLEVIQCNGTNIERRQIGGGDVPIAPTDRNFRFHLRLNCASDPPPNNRGHCGAGSGGTPNTAVQNLLTPIITAAERNQSILNGRTLHSFVRSNASVTRQMLNVPDNPTRDTVIDWVQGAAGSVREGNRMGAVVHSSPTLVGAPSIDIADESYNLFRERPEVSDRPTVVYVGTNDGVLRAFAAGPTYTTATAHPTHPNRTVTRGDQLWGFVPPMVLDKLNNLRLAHNWTVDGTPVIRDVFFSRALVGAPDASIYHTILVAGLRQGGHGFFAMDVTNPLQPTFLWQVIAPDLGQTYGEPALTHVRVRLPGLSTEERGIAIIPGGRGVLRDANGDLVLPDSCAASGHATPTTVNGLASPPRSTRRCWETPGRVLYIVDLETGQTIRKFDHTVFPAPLSGAVSPFLGTTGAVSDRAFFTDADGVIWRLDMSSENPSDWGVKAFHDMFHGMGFQTGQPAYPAPALVKTTQDEVIILQATGDIDRFDDPSVVNRVVSLTEDVQFDGTGNITQVEANLNWEISLSPGEQVTGPLSIFNGRTYFGTFKSTSNPNDACSIGYSRLFGVDLREAVMGTIIPKPGLLSSSAVSEPDVHFLEPSTLTTRGQGLDPGLVPGDDDALYNRLLMGVAVTQLPNCFVGGDVSETDPYIGGSRMTFRIQQSTQRRYELTALLSGGNDRGGDVQEFRRELPPPLNLTSVEDYAGSVD